MLRAHRLQKRDELGRHRRFVGRDGFFGQRRGIVRSRPLLSQQVGFNHKWMRYASGNSDRIGNHAPTSWPDELAETRSRCRMQIIEGFDFFPLTFDDRGQAGVPAGIRRAASTRAKAGPATDAIFIAHGFRNDDIGRDESLHASS